MLHPAPRHHQNGTQEWLGAIFTLLVLTGIYSSMDKFSSYGESPKVPPNHPEVREVSSVASPYWNTTLEYGFRSIIGDVYTSSGSEK